MRRRLDDVTTCESPRVTDFSALMLHPTLLENLASLGYQVMTPIQAQSLPHILAAKDVIGQAKTGSGKTAAFGLGLLQKLDAKSFRVQSLVLCPTRELAAQVAKEIRKLARAVHNIKVLTLCGGTSFGPQAGSLVRGAHIVVGTPGRVEDHLRKGTLKLTNLSTLVLDEADRMLDMGFRETLDNIIEHVPPRRQTLLFSATYPDQIRSIARRIMTRPVIVRVASTHDNTSIAQHFYNVTNDAQRLSALRTLLLKFRPESALVFCNTRQETRQLAVELSNDGFSVAALHGNLEQRDRDQTLVLFANKSISILVATDVAARGLDINSLDAVINYHIAHDAEMHVHRIGRTGRAGSKGIAYSLYSERERHKITALEEFLDQRLDTESLPANGAATPAIYQSPMVTLQIDGGKKKKVRPGDILGALTGEGGISGHLVGKIDIFDRCAYVAVERDVVQAALQRLGRGKLKGRSFRVRRIQS